MTLLQFSDAKTYRPSWRSFFANFRDRWGQGEHVFVFGETGAGKTEITSHMLNSEPFGVMLVTKPGDPIFKSPMLADYRRMKDDWKPRSHDHHIMFSASPGKDMDEERINQRKVFPPTLNKIYRQKGWTVDFDELMHMSDSLGMKRQVSDFFYLGRGLGLTGIASTQRPAWIPPIVPQSCEHAFLSRCRRVDDARALSNLGPDPRELRTMMKSLRSKHDFLYIDTQEEIPIQVVNTHKER